MLAAHPECIPPLREEVETIIEEEGWTKAALGRLQKLDSFMRENQRVNGITNRTNLSYRIIPGTNMSTLSSLRFTSCPSGFYTLRRYFHSCRYIRFCSCALHAYGRRQLRWCYCIQPLAFLRNAGGGRGRHQTPFRQHVVGIYCIRTWETWLVRMIVLLGRPMLAH